MPVRFDFRIEKASATGRYVSGWLSVVEKDGKPVEDSQGDIVAMEEVRKAFHKYMRGSRIIKSQHAGDGIGDLVECVIVDDDFAKAHGIAHGKRGVWGTAEITDEKEQARVRKGEYGGFSIGGRGKRTEIKKRARLLPPGGSLQMRRALLRRSIENNARSHDPAGRIAIGRRLGRAQHYLTRRTQRIVKMSPGAADVHVDSVMGSTKKPIGRGRVRFTLSKRAHLARRALTR